MTELKFNRLSNMWIEHDLAMENDGCKQHVYDFPWIDLR